MLTAEEKKARQLSKAFRKLIVAAPSAQKPTNKSLDFLQKLRPQKKKGFKVSTRIPEKIAPQVQIVEKPVYMGKPGIDGKTPSREQLIDLIKPLIPAPIKGDPGEDGKTPIKGQDYFTEADKQEFKQFLAHAESEEAEDDDFEVTEDMVRQIVKMMRRLPETDKLEIQDIRNAQQFIFNGTKYKTHELMHGGGSSSGSSTNVITEYDLQTKTQDGDNVVVPLSQLTNFATLTNVVAVYRNQIPQTNGITCTITATDVTFLNADVSEIFSITYVYS